MKYLFLLICLFSLGACNAMGFGKNKSTLVFNSSDDMIVVNSDYGVTKIQPNSSATVMSSKFANINSKGSTCNTMMIPTEVNGTALFLDIIPGLIFAGIIPLVVDAIVGFDEMPDNFHYSC